VTITEQALRSGPLKHARSPRPHAQPVSPRSARARRAATTPALLLVRHHGVADADRTVLRAAAGDLQPQHVINLPFWSTLMLDLDAC
jgi:hypothetical protein